jgi:hypothetical protein
VLLLGNGDGTFQGAAEIGTISSAPTGVAVGDFNHDGALDVVFATGGAAIANLGNGHGTFFGEVIFSSGSNDQNVASVIAADVNNDGILDLILNTDSGISVLLGNGDGTFQTAKSSQATVGVMAVADFWIGEGTRRDIKRTDSILRVPNRQSQTSSSARESSPQAIYSRDPGRMGSQSHPPRLAQPGCA